MAYVGINWDHPASAALLHDNRIIAGASEERFTRVKNDTAFPKASIDYCREFARQFDGIEGVGIVSNEVNYQALLYQYASNLSIADHIKEQNEFWYPTLYENKKLDIAFVHKDRWVNDQFPQAYWAEYDPGKIDSFSEDVIDIIAEYLDMDRSRVIRLDHHLCHAYYAYYASPYRGESAIVLTADGFGDGLNATISIAENGTLRRVYETDICVLGRIYRHITLLLGMKPLEHEYKVMGLAPYADQKLAERAYEVFAKILDIDGIEFKWLNKPPDSYFYFKNKLEGLRFDHIAAGIQRWVEEMLCRWVSNIVNQFNIKTIVVSGGVSMNVKAMGKIAAMDCVKKFAVPGSGADETCCIGAAMGAALRFQDNMNAGSLRMDTMYLGPDVDRDAMAVLADAEQDAELIVKRDVTDEYVAELLTKGHIVARCWGHMEYGQRALGNRSILADPTGIDVVNRINSMIKNRDFWMPFAPVVLDTYVDRYLVNPKGLESPHMALAFETTADGWNAMRAACHNADRTARAQILTHEDNPEFYRLVNAFERLTGRGALLNTSFNLHGHPIVNTAQEAYDVFNRSGLEGMLLPEGLILKKKAVKRV